MFETDTTQSQDVSTADLNDSDIDALLGEINSSPESREIPMSDESTSPNLQATQSPQEFEITVGGKTIKTTYTDPRLKQWASQGYDYSQKMAEFNQGKQEFEKTRTQFQEIEGRYKTIDEYVKENPGWWEHVQSEYERKQTGVDQNNPFAKEFSNLKQEINELREFKKSLQTEQAVKQRETEDHQLTQEIESIRKQHPDLDFTTLDAEGKSLEYRIIEHANQNKIPNFRAAFRDFYHDHLVKKAEERGKEQINKDIQKRTKLGLLGTSPTPKKQISDAQDVRNKSYEQLLADALDELGA